jgi:hypothetical protein
VINFGTEVNLDRTDTGRAGLERATEAIQSAVESLRQQTLARVRD